MREGVIEGLQRAIKLIEQYRQFDESNASNEKLDEEDRDRAMNCGIRMVQLIARLRSEIKQAESA